MSIPHLHEELQQNPARVVVHTQYGDVIGGRASTGAVVFLEIPYALPPVRFQNPQPLPKSYRYESKEYITESSYAVQPTNDGQAQGSPFEDKVGCGEPTENPLFLNVVVPPSFPSKGNFPVRIYIHGGFLQFGSPHSLSSQAQFIAAQREEVWVNIGYRVSAFGFLASDVPRLDGNWGFKDQWLGLRWVKENIHAFGGNPENIQLTGLSAGAHSVHQILHHVSQLPSGEMSPFQTASLQSNGILTDPKTPSQLRPQFVALCRGLGLDPNDPDVLDTLRNPQKISWQLITKIIETDSLGPYGTFRGCLSGDWMIPSPGPMKRQRSGEFAEGLRVHGVKAVVIGDLTEEWYLYSIAHPIGSSDDILWNLNRYFPDDVSAKLLSRISSAPESSAATEEAVRLFGDVLSTGQVHLPVRILARDLSASGFPLLRYEIRWTPEEIRPEGSGYVTHGTDRYLWALRKPNLEPKEWDTANRWLEIVDQELEKLIQSGVTRGGHRVVLTLKEDQTIGWTDDKRWDDIMSLVDILPGEEKQGSHL